MVTTSVSLRDRSLSNITYSRQETQLEAQMFKTCLNICGVDWNLCHNTNWHRSTCTLLNRPVLSLFQTVSAAWFFTPALDSHDSRNSLILDLSSRNRTGHLAHCLMGPTNRVFDNASNLKIQKKLNASAFSTLVGPGRQRWAGLRRTGLWGCLDGSCKRWRSCRSIRSDCPERTSRNSCRWTTSMLTSKNKLERYKQPYCFMAFCLHSAFPNKI